MEIRIHSLPAISAAEIVSDQVLIRETQDALDILANCGYQGAGAVLLRQHHLTPDFFDLKSGLAGEILQKFSNYRMQLGLIGLFSSLTEHSKSLKDFMHESNKNGHVVFAASTNEALTMLSLPG